MTDRISVTVTEVQPIVVVVRNAVNIPSVTAWGEVSGTLSDQTDLQTALDAKVSRDTPFPVTDLGTFGATVTLNMAGKAEYHAKGVMPLIAVESDVTFTLSNVPAGATGVVLDFTTGTDVPNLVFTASTPAPTIEASKKYRAIWTPNQTETGYWLQVAERT